jgi:hypothetical protein
MDVSALADTIYWLWLEVVWLSKVAKCGWFTKCHRVLIKISEHKCVNNAYISTSSMHTERGEGIKLPSLSRE